MNFIIDRSKWRCGGSIDLNHRGKGNICLLNGEGFMCCLGQIEKQLGIPENALINTSTPAGTNVKNILTDTNYNGKTYNNELSVHALMINDSPDFNDRQREKKLKQLFSYYGHEISFINNFIK